MPSRDVEGQEREPELYAVDHEDDRGRVWTINLWWGEVDGRAEPISITISGGGRQPITREAVKAIPVGDLVRQSRARFADIYAKRAGDGRTRSPERQQGLELRAAQYSAQRGARLGEEALELVAEVYRAAYAEGTPVVQAVADACFISTSAAAKRIRAARDAGLLEEPTTRGQR